MIKLGTVRKIYHCMKIWNRYWNTYKCLSIRLSVCLPVVCLSVYLYDCLSVYLYVCLFICLANLCWQWYVENVTHWWSDKTNAPRNDSIHPSQTLLLCAAPSDISANDRQSLMRRRVNQTPEEEYVSRRELIETSLSQMTMTREWKIQRS